MGVIVHEYDSDNEAQRTQNLLLARKLASALAWKRGRFALLNKLQELETSDESKAVVQAFFLVLELVTAEIGRNIQEYRCCGLRIDSIPEHQGFNSASSS